MFKQTFKACSSNEAKVSATNRLKAHASKTARSGWLGVLTGSQRNVFQWHVSLKSGGQTAPWVLPRHWCCNVIEHDIIVQYHSTTNSISKQFFLCVNSPRACLDPISLQLRQCWMMWARDLVHHDLLIRHAMSLRWPLRSAFKDHWRWLIMSHGHLLLPWNSTYLIIINPFQPSD